MLTYYINLCSPNIRWRHRFFEIRTPLRGIATGQALTNLATVQGVGSDSRPFRVPSQQAVYQNRSRVSSQQTMMAAIMKMVRKDLLWEVWSMPSWLRINRQMRGSCGYKKGNYKNRGCNEKNSTSCRPDDDETICPSPFPPLPVAVRPCWRVGLTSSMGLPISVLCTFPVAASLLLNLLPSMY